MQDIFDSAMRDAIDIERYRVADGEYVLTDPLVVGQGKWLHLPDGEYRTPHDDKAASTVADGGRLSFGTVHFIRGSAAIASILIERGGTVTGHSIHIERKPGYGPVVLA